MVRCPMLSLTSIRHLREGWLILQYLKWAVSGTIYLLPSTIMNTKFQTFCLIACLFIGFSCVKWKPRTYEKDYVHILKDQGCYSRVGRTGGAQVLSLGRGCVYKGTVLHEMLHASGFWHEQVSTSFADCFLFSLEGNLSYDKPIRLFCHLRNYKVCKDTVALLRLLKIPSEKER